MDKLPAQETLCAHLADMAKKTGLTPLDAGTTVWQTNWTFPTIMPGSHLTDCGKRLWMQVLLEDVSGQVPVRMNERVALKLTNRDNKEELLQAIADGDSVFPTLLSVKTARKIKSGTHRNDGDEEPLVTSFVNLHVVNASAQDWTFPRTQPTRQLIPIMRSFSTMSSAILPISLSMLVQSNLYPLLVQYPVENLKANPCNKVWVLIKANKKSRCTDEPPYTVTTEEVQEANDVDGHTKGTDDPKYTLISICNKENRTSFTLTPKHGKHAFAVAVVSSAQGNKLFAEAVEPIGPEDRNSVAKAMQQEMALAAELMAFAAKASPVTWNEQMSPLSAARCRILGRSPTGPEIDPMGTPPAKTRRIEE